MKKEFWLTCISVCLLAACCEKESLPVTPTSSDLQFGHLAKTWDEGEYVPCPCFGRKDDGAGMASPYLARTGRNVVSGDPPKEAKLFPLFILIWKGGGDCVILFR